MADYEESTTQVRGWGEMFQQFVPQGVEVKIEGQVVTAKGPLGTEVVNVRPEIAVAIEDNNVVLSKVGTSRETDALYGLSRTLVANAVQGVKDGFVNFGNIIFNKPCIAKIFC